MNKEITVEFKMLPIEQLSDDLKQPREKFNTLSDKKRLISSLRELGIQQPIAVLKVADQENHYQIIDGHRRVLCAKEIGIKTVPCRIYQNLGPGDIERVRFELQNNRRLWKPFEKATALANFKNAAGITTNKETAQKLFISETLISNALKLGALKAEYKELMDIHDLAPSYRVEFLKLRPKLRPIKEFTVDDIIKTIFERVEHRVIRSSKDFRTLGRIFLRANANEEKIRVFLLDPDMPVGDLEENTIQSGFSLWLENSLKKINTNEKDGVQFSPQEKLLLLDLQKKLNKIFD